MILEKSFYDQKLKTLLGNWMIVWLNAKETIPMNNENLVSVELNKKRITVNPIKGMID